MRWPQALTSRRASSRPSGSLPRRRGSPPVGGRLPGHGLLGHRQGRGACGGRTGGRLLAGKRIGDRCPCALALSPAVIDPAATAGSPQVGSPSWVSGPATPPWRTREAQRLLDEADDLVGYDLYLDLARPPPAGPGAPAPSPLGAEQERCRFALDRAAEGRSVALISSGDAGIYAMATLVFELIERGGRADWARIEMGVARGSPRCRRRRPGGGTAGARLLRDLALRPADALVGHRAPAEGGGRGRFRGRALHPASRRRRDNWAAREILLRRGRRHAGLLARNLGRADEAIRGTTLAPWTRRRRHAVRGDGRRRARPDVCRGCRAGLVYTPRGYPVR